MSRIRNLMDNLRPTFSKDGKLSFLHSSFDAIDTFLFVPGHTTKGGVHIKDGTDLKRTMFIVVISLIPALLFGMWNVGYQHFNALGEISTLQQNLLYGALQVLPIVVVSYGVGLGIEFAFAQARGHAVNEGFLVTGMLIPLVLPPDIPLWMVAVGTAFCVIIGKEVFGGTGYNFINPALAARAFLFFAYPLAMSGEEVWVSGVDGISTATNLAEATAGKELSASFMDSFMGWIPGSVGETSTLMCLIGALILGLTGVGSIRIMLSVFVGGLLMGWTINSFAPADSFYMNLPAHYHLVMGGFAFGAVFMATDPVSAPKTPKGKLIYGLLIGAFAVLVRIFNPGFPEGMMMVIIFMNVFSATIDNYVIEGQLKRRLARA
jgi:Na+-transporting NADH:ubiquinone oxidoreductase subunit B